jgi:hypothetical protein
MARDDRDLQDVAAERPRSRTDRLEGGRSPAGEPINPQWRSTRTSGRTRSVRSIPTSGQDFALWLQFGGWRFVLAVGAIVVVIALLIILTGQPAAEPLAGGDIEPTLAPASQPSLLQTPLPTITMAPASPTAPPAVTGVRFRVTGTGAEGLFLRPEPNTNGPPLKTLPEGSEVTIIGEDSVQSDRVWKHVRDAVGAEGWVAADFVREVGP